MYFSLRRKIKKWAIEEVYIQCKSCESEKSSAYKGPDTPLRTIKRCQVPSTTHYQKEHAVKKADPQQHFLSLIVTGVALQQVLPGPLHDGFQQAHYQKEHAVKKADPQQHFLSLNVTGVALQQVGNTCAPRALLTGLESMYSKAELQATSYGDIDQRVEGVGSEWIEPHQEACDLD
jgi:hypothetical protein